MTSSKMARPGANPSIVHSSLRHSGVGSKAVQRRLESRDASSSEQRPSPHMSSNISHFTSKKRDKGEVEIEGNHPGSSTIGQQAQAVGCAVTIVV